MSINNKLLGLKLQSMAMMPVASAPCPGRIPDDSAEAPSPLAPSLFLEHDHPRGHLPRRRARSSPLQRPPVTPLSFDPTVPSERPHLRH